MNAEELIPIPNEAELVSDNGVSMVWKGYGWYYKRSIPYFIQNELHFMSALQNTGFVPDCILYDKYTLKIEEVQSGWVDSEYFQKNCKDFLWTLEQLGIRHGDLTRPHVFMSYDGIKIIDWAESRWIGDPAPDKRIEGDKYWMNRTMREILRR